MKSLMEGCNWKLQNADAPSVIEGIHEYHIAIIW